MDQAKNQELNQEIDQELNQELNQEKDHLKLVRDWIRQKQINNTSKIAGLQDRVGQLKKAAGGTFSQEYELKYNSLNYLQGETRDFAEALDKPYFGRIDFKERLSLEIERFYIGKHGVRDIRRGRSYRGLAGTHRRSVLFENPGQNRICGAHGLHCRNCP